MIREMMLSERLLCAQDRTITQRERQWRLSANWSAQDVAPLAEKMNQSRNFADAMTCSAKPVPASV